MNKFLDGRAIIAACALAISPFTLQADDIRSGELKKGETVVGNWDVIWATKTDFLIEVWGGPIEPVGGEFDYVVTLSERFDNGDGDDWWVRMVFDFDSRRQGGGNDHLNIRSKIRHLTREPDVFGTHTRAEPFSGMIDYLGGKNAPTVTPPRDGVDHLPHEDLYTQGGTLRSGSGGFGIDTWSAVIDAKHMVPEPASLALLAMGIPAVLRRRR